MDADEQEIFNYLENAGEQWVHAKEVCRRAAGKRRYNDDNNWAKPVLLRMKEKRIVEGDLFGRFRLPPAKKEHGGPVIEIPGDLGEGEIPEGTEGETDEPY